MGGLIVTVNKLTNVIKWKSHKKEGRKREQRTKEINRKKIVT